MHSPLSCRAFAFSPTYLPKQLNQGPSKAVLVRGFLESNCGRAFYSVEVREALAERGVWSPDVMASARQLERKGLVHMRRHIYS